jgi:geranylgeranyl reductase family protein
LPQPSTSGSLDCDVLIAGAGPAGCSAARSLAQRGLRVILVDQRAFPRDKVCGDGLISDALGALEALGLLARVAQHAVRSSELRIYPPSRNPVSIHGEFACLPRQDLDLVLWNAAAEAGAICSAGLTALAPLESGGRVTGVRFSGSSGGVEIKASVTLLATGANATVLGAFGLAPPRSGDAVAGRAYFSAPPDVIAQWPCLLIAFERGWCPGYGWIFPSPGNRFNIGVGLFGGASNRRLRDFWRAFVTSFPPAAAIVRASTQLSPFKGAPLRTGLTAARFGRPGLLAVGEAASMTYSATGEGIGKAMESGLLAATMAAECVGGQRPVDTLHEEYGQEFRRRFQFRYKAYAVAQAWAAYPVILNILAARAAAGRFARAELEALLAERGDARRLFSKRGLLSALVR